MNSHLLCSEDIKPWEKWKVHEDWLWKRTKQWDKKIAQKIKFSNFLEYGGWFVNGINHLNGIILEFPPRSWFYLWIWTHLGFFRYWFDQKMMLQIHYFKVVLLLISSLVGIRTAGWQDNIPAKLFIDMGELSVISFFLFWFDCLKNLLIGIPSR